MFGSTDFRDDPQAPDEENARSFFGFSPGEDFDAFTLRARKLKRDDQARNQRERDLVQRYFAILAPSVGIAVTTRAPSPPQQDEARPKLPAYGDAYVPSPPAEVQATLRQLERELHYALHTEVIQSTINAYTKLFHTLVTLARLLGVDPKTVGNAWVRSQMRPATPEAISRTQLEEVIELLPEGLHVSLGGTPEFNHPTHQYVANAPEARLGLQFGYILDAIRDKARELLEHPPADRWVVF